ncbi:MAG TPA: COX15/CtaA family protein [Hyphomicrobiaceae bacterium]|nr:COX15/CtaA family protein [Hyphomicrobiaceae bacterium]
MVTATADRVERGEASAVRLWLFSMAALVLLMVAVGGATRLTGSGLSITEWQPILGIIPPLTDADWHDAFEKYRQIPEYRLVNKGMSLAEFKAIYWWEWAHRFLGRLIGLAFALPLAVFWLTGALPRRLGLPLLGLLGLGAVQGFIGWYMVQSGLADRVDVSQYRLALHLSLAVLIFGLLLWLALGLGPEPKPPLRPLTAAQKVFAVGLVALLFMQVVLGAFVAGLKAGLTYNTWPLMDGGLVPAGVLALEPWYLNLFENVATVQFNHRVAAYVVVLAALWQAIALSRARADARLRASAWMLLAAVVAQAALGVWTLLSVVALPLGIAHQAGAVAVFGLAVWHLYQATGSRFSRVPASA